MKFYLGIHQPAWLERDLGIPLLVSHRRLAGRRTLPRATHPWAVDSGGFSELSLYGRWRSDARSYVAAVRRYAEEIGNLEWAAPQDWMVEAAVRARTGLSVRAHLQRTVRNYLQLRDLAPELPIIPIVQGDQVTDYHRCADLYERHGVDLAALSLVGVGSVCRRSHTGEVERIVRSLHARGLVLHCFGVKILGLARYGEAIASSDSAAWSFSGRYVAGCTPSHRSEANCLRYALDWHARLHQRITATTVAGPVRSDPEARAGTVTRRSPQRRRGYTHPDTARPASRPAHGRADDVAGSSPGRGARR
ncbi:Uncharacterised protein [Amycolatopsis camponoti]|uniref:DeoxyPurine in DNA protein A domain-containing protein n=1 Tax=Amycolatopsis camponoti TaxID=2606593 RepID=A0A6I8M4U5_9PSEU|nr:hypothetical protein [Amycolatopsis camponoti]VVJ22680.1 Uncharacterised protein [Amycolatopsis camponoti]